MGRYRDCTVGPAVCRLAREQTGIDDMAGQWMQAPAAVLMMITIAFFCARLAILARDLT